MSVGAADFVVETLRRHGKVGFWKVAMKPGTPIAFGKAGQALFFGLPGNPFSAMATFHQLVQPALKTLAGSAEVDLPMLLERDAQGAYVVCAVSHQGAGVLRSMTEANCFIVLPLEQETVPPGTEVSVQPFAGLV